VVASAILGFPSLLLRLGAGLYTNGPNFVGRAKGNVPLAWEKTFGQIEVGVFLNRAMFFGAGVVDSAKDNVRKWRTRMTNYEVTRGRG